jgi:hypothetical protein
MHIEIILYIVIFFRPEAKWSNYVYVEYLIVGGQNS